MATPYYTDRLKLTKSVDYYNFSNCLEMCGYSSSYYAGITDM